MTSWGRAPTRLAALVALVSVLLLCSVTAGCTVSEPDTAEWRDLARQSLSDAASEVATVEVTLRAVRQGDVWSSYAITVVAQAEKELGTAEETLSTAQPPEGRYDDTEDLLGLLDRAADAVKAGRADLVAGTEVDLAVVKRLGRLASALEHRASEI